MLTLSTHRSTCSQVLCSSNSCLFHIISLYGMFCMSAFQILELVTTNQTRRINLSYLSFLDVFNFTKQRRSKLVLSLAVLPVNFFKLFIDTSFYGTISPYIKYIYKTKMATSFYTVLYSQRIILIWCV